MPRTTIDIDEPILRELKRRQKAEAKPLSRLVSDLLAAALKTSMRPAAAPRFEWKSSRMGPARIDLEDKEALRRALDDESVR